MEMQHEHPWNTRRITHTVQHQHRNLIEVHLMGHAWNAGLPSALQSKKIKNPFDQEPYLDDDTFPEAVIQRLELQIWNQLIDWLSTHLSQVETHLDSVLAKCFQTGSDCAKKRWQLTALMRPTPLHALLNSPFSGSHQTHAFLVRRNTEHSCKVELLLPALHSVKALADTEKQNPVRSLLHSFISEWIRGYLTVITPQMDFRVIQLLPSCVIEWTVHQKHTLDAPSF